MAIIHLLLSLPQECGVDPAVDNSHALPFACAGGHIEVVQLLLALLLDRDLVQLFACKQGHSAVVELLLTQAGVRTSHMRIGSSCSWHIRMWLVAMQRRSLACYTYSGTKHSSLSNNGGACMTTTCGRCITIKWSPTHTGTCVQVVAARDGGTLTQAHAKNHKYRQVKLYKIVVMV